jgi:hypothetical protein
MIYPFWICWMICFIRIVRLPLTTGNLVYLISTTGTWRLCLVSRGCSLPLGTWSYIRICQGFLHYDYVWHIVNFTILYIKCTCKSLITSMHFIAQYTCTTKERPLRVVSTLCQFLSTFSKKMGYGEWQFSAEESAPK